MVTAASDAFKDRAAATVIDMILAQADAEPANHVLRLAVARLGWSFDSQCALGTYKRLVKDGTLLDEVINDLHDQSDATADAWLQQRIYRLLGDAYMRQHRVIEAMQAYGHAFPHYTTPQQG